MTLKTTGLLFTTLVLYSCMTKGKVTKTVEKYFSKNEIQLHLPENKHNFILLWDSLPLNNTYCASKSEKFFVIPLVFYYFSKERISCTLNQKLYIGKIVTTLNSLLENEEYRSRLHDKTIELNFISVPSTFYHQYTSHCITPLVIPLVFPFTENEFYRPESRLAVSYKVKTKTQGELLKKGIADEVLNEVREIKPREGKRVEYLNGFASKFDYDIERACQQVAQTLINEFEIN